MAGMFFSSSFPLSDSGQDLHVTQIKWLIELHTFFFLIAIPLICSSLDHSLSQHLHYGAICCNIPFKWMHWLFYMNYTLHVISENHFFFNWQKFGIGKDFHGHFFLYKDIYFLII